jgi:hypothetical protein
MAARERSPESDCDNFITVPRSAPSARGQPERWPCYARNPALPRSLRRASKLRAAVGNVPFVSRPDLRLSGR